MNDRNLYAPPKAELSDVKAGNCTRDGKDVIVKTGSDLPPRCIVCNAPAALPIKSKKLYWHSPWIYVLILLNIIVYLIVGIIARKSFDVSAGLCKAHDAKRKRRLFSLLGSGMALLIIAGALARDQGAAAGVLCVLALLLLVGAAIAGRKVYARKITKEYARLRGCKEPFLASLE